jgi:hypothetical protein
MDFLGELMVASFEAKEDEFGETRGRPRLLKTYVLEANRNLLGAGQEVGLLINRTDTSLPEVSIFRLEHANIHATFYVDTTDRRFWLLHTNDLADDTRYLFNRLALSPEASFDKVWLPTEMIQKVANLPRNDFRGFGLDYLDFFALNLRDERPVEELKMRVSGSSSMEALDALRSRAKLRNSLSYSMLRVKRGDRQHFAISELGYEGRFTARGGTSIDDYSSLVEITKKIYKNTVEAIERSSIGVKEVENRTLIEGQAFDFILEREIIDMELFIDILTRSKQPFRLWGLKNKVTKDNYQVLCVDLHTGDSIDLEISPFLLRVYLPKGSCGNTILRLYTNLQHYFDSNLKLNDKPLQISNE